MKHTIADDINVNLNIDIPSEDVIDIIDKVTESALAIIAAVTAAYVLKSLFEET